MKKAIRFSIILAVFAIISLFAVTVHASDHIKFTDIQTYNGVTYTCVNTNCVGEITANDVSPLPNTCVNYGDIYRFAIYYDKIYYITGYEGTSGVLGSIYRCNLDGSGNELIANDADALGNAFLSDGCLYYNVFCDYSNFYGRNLNGGIMKINLNTGAYARIITDYNASLINVLDDKIFYCVWDGYHLMNAAGAYIGGISPNDVEVVADIIIGATAYSTDGFESIYAYDWKWNGKWVCHIPLYVTGGYEAYNRSATVVNVTGGYIYYTIPFNNPELMYRTVPNVAMYRVPVSGGERTLIAKWFIS